MTKLTPNALVRAQMIKQQNEIWTTLSSPEMRAAAALDHLILCGAGGLSMAHILRDGNTDSRLLPTAYPRLYKDPNSSAVWTTTSKEAYYATLSGFREALVEYERIVRTPHALDGIWSLLEAHPVNMTQRYAKVKSNTSFVPNPYTRSVSALNMVRHQGYGGEVLDAINAVENLFTQFKGGVRYNEHGKTKSYPTT